MANKRGRKRTTEMYFGPDEEQAVIKFLESNDQKERNELYTTWLKGPLDKMVESIINTQLGKHLINYNKYYDLRYCNKRILNWFPHFGEYRRAKY
jgi:hypothetical protein